MADRGRDLKVSILSDASQFDTSDAASDLEKLASSAKQADQSLDSLGKGGTGLDRLERDAKDAGQALDRLGRDAKDADSDLDRFATEAKETANKVDSAFDKIAKSSKSNIGEGTKHGLKEAESGLDEFKGEANETGREAAASFSGSFEDAADAVQETLAQALAGFGPMGAAAGLAAAAGLGIMLSSLTDAADRANKMGEDIAALAGEIADAGGALDAETVSKKMQSWALEIEDQRSIWEVWQRRSTTNLEMVAKSADQTGVGLKDMFGAMSGQDSSAAFRALDQLSSARTKLTDSMVGSEAAIEGENSATTAQLRVIDDAIEKIKDKNGITAEGVSLSQTLIQALGEQKAAEEAATKAREDAAKALEATNQAYIDGMSVMDEFNSETERVGDVAKVTAQGVLDAANQQTEAMVGWADNMHSLAARVPPEMMAELQKLGPQGAQQVALLNSMTDAQLQAWVANQQRQGAAAALALVNPARQAAPEIAAAYRVLGAGATQAMADGMLSQQAQVREAARVPLAAAQGVMSAGIRVQLGLDTADFYANLARARAAAKEIELNRNMP